MMRLLAVWLLGCGGPTEAPAPPPAAVPARPAAAAPAPEAPSLGPRVDAAVSAVYGADGMGMADPSPDALVEFVSIHKQDDHVVYVTHGVHKSPVPHEFVLRIRHAAATSDRPLIEVAPQWPVALLVEVAEAEARTGEVFRFLDSLGHIAPDRDLPYRNVAFMRDPVLPAIEDGAVYVAFVQVVPFSDADYAVMDAIEEGQPNTVLRDRMTADRLGLVDG